MERSVGQVAEAGDGRGVGEAGVQHTGLQLVETDHVIWILPSDWSMSISSNFPLKSLLGKTQPG